MSIVVALVLPNMPAQAEEKLDVVAKFENDNLGLDVVTYINLETTASPSRMALLGFRSTSARTSFVFSRNEWASLVDLWTTAVKSQSDSWKVIGSLTEMGTADFSLLTVSAGPGVRLAVTSVKGVSIYLCACERRYRSLRKRPFPGEGIFFAKIVVSARLCPSMISPIFPTTTLDDRPRARARAGSRHADPRRKTVPVDSFAANPWGLYQVHGNVWEWCEDCWNASYGGAPSDGAAWTSGDCSLRVLRGGSWISYPRILRSAFRGRFHPDFRTFDIGFRVAGTL